jgi:hypothetical protein
MAIKPLKTTGNTMRKEERQVPFPLGATYTTPGAFYALKEANVWARSLLMRHMMGDWGDVCEADKAENEFSLREGYRLLSAYTLPTGVKLWVITEADRSSTTILLPEEY